MVVTLEERKWEWVSKKVGVGLKESGSGSQRKWEWVSKKISNTWMVLLDT